MNMPSRVAFNLFGKDIYWYGVIMAAAMIIAVGLAYSEERRKKLKKDTVIDPVSYTHLNIFRCRFIASL